MRYLIIVALFSVGCSHVSTISEKDDVWVAEQMGAYQTIYYCRANKTEKGTATPVCFEATNLKLKAQ